MPQFIRYKGFCGPSNSLENFNYDQQRTVNRYVEYDETQLGKNAEPSQMLPFPGLVPLKTGLAGFSRDGYVTSTNKCYWCFGTTMYLIQGKDSSLNPSDWTLIPVGALGGSGSGFTIHVATTNSFGRILTLSSIISPGSGYQDGTYNSIFLTGGTGELALANITISGGTVISVTLVSGGDGYTDGDTLSISPSSASVVSGTTNVQYSDNATTLFAVAADVGITYGIDIATNTLTIMTSPTFGDGWEPATSTTYFDTYCIFSQKGTNQFFWTDPLSNIVEGVNFAAAETNADHINCVFSNNENLWVFGENVTEIWYDYGQNNITFARQQNLLVETGSASQYTVKKLNNTLMWLSTDQRGGPIVYMAKGFQPIRVSKFDLETQLGKCTQQQLSLATADSYTWNGHYFYELNVPGLSSTWVFDMTSYLQSGMMIWTERQNGYGSEAHRHIGQGHCYFMGLHLRGDYRTGNLYAMDINTNTENGELVTRIRRTPYVTDGISRIRHNCIQIDYAPGTSTQPTVEPISWLRFSDDGKNWSNEMYLSLGPIGFYTQIMRRWQLGISRNRVYEISDCFDGYSAISGAEIFMKNLDS